MKHDYDWSNIAVSVNEKHFEQARMEYFALENLEIDRYLPGLRGDTKKVLLVEDDFSQITIVDAFLKESHHNVRLDWEVDPTKAINRLNFFDYDLIICDVIFDGKLSGIDLLKHCASTKNKQEILLISAHEEQYLREKIYTDFWPLSYLKKPINFLEFLSTVSPLLNKNEG